jgi:peroxiredoxin Q/BCP
MTLPKKGEAAFSFCLPDANEKRVCLKDIKGQWVVLYFYPKDNTSGCTLEAIDFSKSIDAFIKLKAVVIGVSPDSPKSHCNFRDRHNLKVKLLSDENHEVMDKYAVWIKKKMYGKEYFGVERSTFLIDPSGKIVSVWRKVNVPGHIDIVLEKIKAIQNNRL